MRIRLNYYTFCCDGECIQWVQTRGLHEKYPIVSEPTHHCNRNRKCSSAMPCVPFLTLRGSTILRTCRVVAINALKLRHLRKWYLPNVLTLSMGECGGGGKEGGGGGEKREGKGEEIPPQQESISPQVHPPPPPPTTPRSADISSPRY